MEPVDKEMPLTAEDFRNSGWQDIVKPIIRRYNSELQTAFSDAARKAEEDGEHCKARCLNLLATICSMVLSPEKFNEPFKPYMVFDGKRTLIPEDLKQDDVIFLSQIVEEIDHHWLKARVADIVWLLLRPKNVAFALTAIDNYMESPLDSDSLVSGGRELWKRAIFLCINLRKGSGDRIEKIEQTIFSAFRKASGTDGYLAIWLAELLGLARSKHLLKIAQQLESIAAFFDTSGDYGRAANYFSRTVMWYSQAKENSMAVKAAISEAEMLAKQGYARITGSNASHMAGVHFFEKAIQLYRVIPKAERIVYGVDKRIVDLYHQLAVSGEKTLDELTPVSSSLDITEIVNEARAKVEGKGQMDALFAFANIHSNTDKKTLREQSEKFMYNNPLSSLFPSTVFSGDGRVIAKTSGLDLHNPDADSNEGAVFASMVSDYTNLIGVIVQGCIIPALQTLQLEHRFTEADFMELCERTPILPRGSEVLMGRALSAGFESDFTLSLHLLIPQVESFVRFHLKRKGAKTTTLGIDGIQTENGLSTLVDLPEMEQVFGEDLTFEIKALFCDSRGPNLRNQLAHGLLSYTAFQSAPSIYAWWFWLKIVVNSFISADNKPD